MLPKHATWFVVTTELAVKEVDVPIFSTFGHDTLSHVTSSNKPLKDDLADINGPLVQQILYSNTW